MVRFLMAALLASAFSQGAFAYSRSAFSLEKNKEEYQVGDTATLAVRYEATIENPDYEYFATSTLNGQSLKVTATASNFAVAITNPLTVPGTYTWTVNAFIQDRKLAQDLVNSISFLVSENDRITREISQTTSPDIIAALQKERTRNIVLIDRAEAELLSLRRPVGSPQSLTFEVL